MIRTIGITIALGLALSACGPQRPAIDPALESGITSSNGGGTRELRNTNSTTLGTTGPGVGTTNGGSGAVGRAY